MVELLVYADTDRELTLALESDPDVVGHLGGTLDGDAAAKVHERRMAAIAGGDLFFTIVPDGGAEPVGVIAVWRSEWESQPIHELGVMLLPRYQAQGLAGTAIRLLLPRAAAAGVNQVHVFPAVTNGPSNTVAGRLGFRRLADCDLEYEDRPLRCTHWVLDLPG